MKLIDNTTLKDRRDKFTILDVNVQKVVKDWKNSVFSFEWLTPDGQVRNVDLLGEAQAQKYETVKKAYTHNEVLERPVLGLGMMDFVEIGSRKEVLLTLHSLGVERMEVHVPKSCLDDFQKFI